MRKKDNWCNMWVVTHNLYCANESDYREDWDGDQCQDYGFHTQFSLLFLVFLTSLSLTFPMIGPLTYFLIFFLLKLSFHSNRSHMKKEKVSNWICWVVVQDKKKKLLSSIDEGWTLHWPWIKSLSHSKTLFVVTTLYPLQTLCLISYQH